MKIGLAVFGIVILIAIIYVVSDVNFLDRDQADMREVEPEEHLPAESPDGEKEQEAEENEPEQNEHEPDEESPSEPLLQAGDSGDGVRELQEQLNQVGYDVEVDGIYGITTQWYVKDFQSQLNLPDDGTFYRETAAALEQALAGDVNIEPGRAIHLQLENRTITNASDLLALVNKTRSLPEDYAPEDLIQPDVPLVFQGENLPYNKIRRVAAEALEDLFEQAKQEGLQFIARSGFRSYETQQAVFARNVEERGEEEANKYSARPGESEHQTGLAIDVSSPGVNHELVIQFEDTPEGQWLQQHAQDFGFIIRYPKGKEEITGYQYEPWHLRYVGIDAAKEIHSQGLTLEEYLLLK